MATFLAPVLLVAILGAVSNAARQPLTLPSSFPRCVLKQADYETCLNNAVQVSMRALADGLPSLGMLPIDPMLVTEMNLMHGTGPVNVDLIFKNTTLFGLKDAKSLKVSNDILAGGANMRGELLIPRLNLMADYSIKGKILLLPIHGDGMANITLAHLKATYEMENEFYKKKNGQQHIRVKEFKLKLRPGKTHTNFANLFNGDKRLSDQMNMILNDHADDIWGELSPTIEATFGEICKQLANRLFSLVPYKNIFPLEETTSSEVVDNESPARLMSFLLNTPTTCKPTMVRDAMHLIVLLCFVSLATAARTPNLPSSFPRCKVGIPKEEYSECLNAAVQKAFHIISTKGIPSLGVFPADPLQVSEIGIAEGGRAVRLQLTLSKARLQGFNSTRLLSSSNDIADGGSTLRAEILVPRLEIISLYEIKGQILLLPISGKGDSSITLGNLNVVIKIENDIEERNGEEYFNVRKFKIILKPETISMNFENLFNGDPVLGTHMNRFMNDNSVEIFGELRNSIQDAFSEIFLQLTKRIFDQVPYKKVFLH
ncbi:uncharacterized protein LOC132201681 [Neocloeon triangulifer]|uniref:uncharacterized protein LOC132201681 n=1 Tax=Neocloeon triangulifer TaxID=2078957 RepID=UPI00286F3F26|nr:uncharacterized protein LOC132201681 [Neocloeon triangulifer]